MKKGQGMFEYILLLAGVLLVVVLAIALLRGGLFQSGATGTEVAACKNRLVTASVCYDAAGTWLENAQVPFNDGDSCLTLLPNDPAYTQGGGLCGGVAGAMYCECGPNPRS